MLDFQLLGMFSLASILLALSPGPDNLFVLTQSMAKGSKVGILITLGLCSGLVFHTLAVALGVAVIFQTSLFAFKTLYPLFRSSAIKEAADGSTMTALIFVPSSHSFKSSAYSESVFCLPLSLPE